jgi:hypothetical protein
MDKTLFVRQLKEVRYDPGSTIIRECSACRKHVAEQTIGSGNTFGARFWTDGKIDAPMLPDQPWLIKCQHCGTLVWIDELTQAGKIDPGGVETLYGSRFSDARPGLAPTLQDYAAFLETGLSDKQKERYVRLRYWWAGNDSRRGSDQSKPLDSFETENLRAFVNLLDESEEGDRLMKAEALRELGEFAEAKRLLAPKFDDDLAQAVSIIRDLNKKRVTTVEEMRFE